MHPHQKLVREFHERFGLTINDTPTLSPKDDALRHNLHREEFSELDQSFSRIETADALADLRYVLLGSAVTYGLSPEAATEARDPHTLVAHFGRLEEAIDNLRLDLSSKNLALAAESLGDALHHSSKLAEWFSIPLDAVFQEVHRSNMSKLWTDAEIHERNKGFAVLSTEGGVTKWVDGISAVRVSDEERSWLVKRADGKALKSPSYSPADIAGVLERHK